MDLISVIIPIYNVEKYLKKCVDSVVGQTYENLEIILVDDGSPDNCGAICDEYKNGYTPKDYRKRRFTVIHKNNGGLSDARNAGIDAAQGKYLVFLDSDDYLAEDAVESLYSALIGNDADIATGNIVSVDENGAVSDYYVPYKELKVLNGREILSTLHHPCAPDRLYKSDIFSDIRFPVGRLYEDAFIYHRILGKTNRMVMTGKTCYYYLVRPGSIMRSSYDIRFTDIIFALEDRCDWLDSIGENRLANEERLYIYSRAAVAFAHLDKSNEQSRRKLAEISVIFNRCYSVLMKDREISFKQKMRLTVLRFFPGLHSSIWGKNMEIALG